MSHRIDAVITWVDGNDPAHRARRAVFQADTDLSAASDTRFADNGEIYRAIASLLKYAPFIDRIFVVADRQRPALIESFAAEGLCAADRIRMVDHAEIFRGFEDAIPTFSSRSIESALWRIPDLAPHFLYLNDDFVLTAPMSPGDLLTPDGRPILRGRMRPTRLPLAKLALRRLLSRGEVAPHFKYAQVQSARLLGLGVWMPLHHHPHILRRETFRALHDAHPRLFARQVGFRFRHVDQLAPVALANHHEIATGAAAYGDPFDVAYMRPRAEARIERALEEIRAGSVRFACVQSLDEIAATTPDLARTIVATLDAALSDTLPRAVRTARAIN